MADFQNCHKVLTPVSPEHWQSGNQINLKLLAKALPLQNQKLKTLLQYILLSPDTLLIVVSEFNYTKAERPASSKAMKYN